MFSQACVKNSAHRGVSASVYAWMHTPRANTPRADAPGQITPLEDTPWQQMTTAADGAHPNGMHSGFGTDFKINKQNINRGRMKISRRMGRRAYNGCDNIILRKIPQKLHEIERNLGHMGMAGQGWPL